ncbi:MAG: sigma-70 family RNA polymerase sigma factor [Polyangiaceae bacterium]
MRDASAPPSLRDAIDHIDALYRLAARLTRDEEAAADLVQETYARALAAQDQFVVGTNARAWLFRILRNAVIDRARREKVSPLRGGFEEENEKEAVTAQEPLRGDAELERLRHVVAEDIEAALRTLSLDARTVILLDLEGLSEPEVAEVMGCSPGTVKSRLSRARAKLRERLRDYARDEE